MNFRSASPIVAMKTFCHLIGRLGGFRSCVVMFVLTVKIRVAVLDRGWVIITTCIVATTLVCLFFSPLFVFAYAFVFFQQHGRHRDHRSEEHLALAPKVLRCLQEALTLLSSDGKRHGTATCSEYDQLNFLLKLLAICVFFRLIPSRRCVFWRTSSSS